MRNFFIILSALYLTSAFSNEGIDYKEVIVQDNCLMINTFENVTYKLELFQKRRNKLLLSVLDSIILDTIIDRPFINNNFYLTDNNKSILIINAKMNQFKVEKYNLQYGDIELLHTFDGEFLTLFNNKILFGSKESINMDIKWNAGDSPFVSPVRTLLAGDLKTGIYETLFVLPQNVENNSGITGILNLNNSLIVQHCIKNSDATVDECKYFEVDQNKFKTNNISFSEKLINQSIRNYRLTTDNMIIINKHVYDKKLQYIGELNGKSINRIGYYDTDDYKGIYVRSTTDKKIGAYSYESAVIVINETAAFELAMYDIVNNKEITNDLISDLSLDNLDLLKKSVWAKHNFAFVDLYEQAYFNLYYFYNKGKDSRKTRVENKFTGTDKVNLKLIEEVIKEKGGR